MDAENTAVNDTEQTVAQPQGEKQVATQDVVKEEPKLSQDDVNRIYRANNLGHLKTING